VDVSGRWLLEVVVLSVGLAVLGLCRRDREAHTRRAFGLAAACVLVVAPLLLHAIPAWRVAWASPPAWWDLLSGPLSVTLLAVWAAGTCLGWAHLGAAVVRTRRFAASLPRWTGPRAEHMLAELRGEISMATPILLRPSRDATPYTFGARRPVIVLPATAEQWPAGVLRAVLAHELEHVKRHDATWLLVLRFVRAAYWFVPWIAVLFRDCARAIEESCDDRAVRWCTDESHYAHALVTIARTAPSCGAAAGMAAHPLVERVRRLGAPRHHESNVASVIWRLVPVLLCVGVACHVELAVSAPTLTVRVVSLEDTARGRVQGTPADDVPIYPRVMSDSALALPVPIYPGAALAAGVEGEVQVRYRIAGDGRVVNARVVASEPAGVFDAAVLRAFAGHVPDRAPACAAFPSSCAGGVARFWFRIRFEQGGAS